MLSAGVSLGLIGCGGGDATRVAALSVRADAQQQNPDALTSGASCEALLATFQRRLIEQVTERAASMRGGEPAAYYGGVFTDDVAPRSGAALAAARSQALDGAAPLDSEPSTASPGSEDGDIVKVSGDRVYLLHGPSLYVLDAASPELALASEVALEGEPTQLFVTGDRALVLSRIIGPLLGADELYPPYAY